MIKEVSQPCYACGNKNSSGRSHGYERWYNNNDKEKNRLCSGCFGKLIYYPKRKFHNPNYTHYYNLSLKKDAINNYSNGKNCCACCGIKDIIFLTINHEQKDGAKHRKETGNGMAFYLWLKKKNYPKNFNVLCFNCNWAYSHGGCPHKKLKEQYKRNLYLFGCC